ncbi:minor capsid protein [Rhizobium phaseoli]|uniref:Phage head morphogenesis protein n=1 Tax=Rhizobium phaseoli TaxID=396 RepID=A0ABM6C8Z2_9HYPH|nr:minor capsid protein [Rhizobium phaseoli]ANL84663.1 phage head morphogenesis protein [Rhizobium phaseoli]ANL91170.1 phage head morphogenesis protein [Rhizobium phaseoli]
MPTANEEALDASVRHQIGLLRYSSSVVKKIVGLLNRVDDRLVKELVKRGVGDQGFTQRRLELLLDSVRSIIAEAYGRATTSLSDELKALSSYERDFQINLLGKALPVRLDLIKPTSAQLYAAVMARPFDGRLLKDWYADLEAGAYRRLRDTIRMGYVEGRTTDQIVRDIRGTRAQQYRDGILEVSRRGAEATVRTAVNHTATVARNETYKENASVIKGIRWVSTLDARTSAVCRGRDGKVYPLDSGPRPPAHLNCRSSTAPVLKSWKELGINLKEAPEGTRASMDGQVAASVTYSEWLRRQPKEVQDDILGPTKAKLFRAGGLELDRFIDTKGQEYTLDQLRQREGDAWEKAFGGKPKPEAKPATAPNRTAIEGRNEFERIYATKLGKDLDERYVKAFENTTPVKLKDTDSGGFYRFDDHSMSIPADWRTAENRAKWVGTFAHEYGHAIDADGRTVVTLRSAAMADAIAEDRRALMAWQVKASDVPPAANEHLRDLMGGNDEAVAEFGRLMTAGDFDRAMDTIKRELLRRHQENGYTVTDDLLLDMYALGNMRDFLGSVTDLGRGYGHSKLYYSKFPSYRDDGRGGQVTAAHAAEAFANAFMANVLEKHALWAYMIEQMGPRTARAFRAIIDEVANG